MAELGVALVGCGTVGSARGASAARRRHVPRGRAAGAASRSAIPARRRAVDLDGTASPRVTRCRSRGDADVGLVLEASGDTALGRAPGAARRCAAAEHFVTAGKDLVASTRGRARGAGSRARRRVPLRGRGRRGGADRWRCCADRLSPARRARVQRGAERHLQLRAGRAGAPAARSRTRWRGARARVRGARQHGATPSGRDTADKVAILARLLGVQRRRRRTCRRDGIDAPRSRATSRTAGGAACALRLRGFFLRTRERAWWPGVGPAFVPEPSLLGAGARRRERGRCSSSARRGRRSGSSGPAPAVRPPPRRCWPDVRETSCAREAGRPLPRPREAGSRRTATPRRHFVRVDGGPELGRVVLQRLHDRGLAPEWVTSPRAGCFQVVGGPAATQRVRDALAGVAPQALVILIVEGCAPPPRRLAAKDVLRHDRRVILGERIRLRRLERATTSRSCAAWVNDPEVRKHPGLPVPHEPRARGEVVRASAAGGAGGAALRDRRARGAGGLDPSTRPGRRSASAGSTRWTGRTARPSWACSSATATSGGAGLWDGRRAHARALGLPHAEPEPRAPARARDNAPAIRCYEKVGFRLRAGSARRGSRTAAISTR